MTIAAEPGEQRPADAVRPAVEGVAHLLVEPAEQARPSAALTLLPSVDGVDAGLCSGGFCRLPGARD